MAFNWKNIGRGLLGVATMTPWNLIIPKWREDLLNEARTDIKGLTEWWRNDVKGEQDARDWEMKMWQMDKAAKEEAWHRENAYNSYANQMSLAAQAGLNPHLLHQGSAAAGSLGTPSPRPNPVKSASDMPAAIASVIGGIPEIFSKFIRVKQDIATLRKQEIENEYLEENLQNRNLRGTTTNEYLAEWLRARNKAADANASMQERRDAQFDAELMLKQAVMASQIENFRQNAALSRFKREETLPTQIALWKSVQALNDARTSRVRQQMTIDNPKVLEAELLNDLFSSPNFGTTYKQAKGSGLRRAYEENLTGTEKALIDSVLYQNYLYPSDPFNYRSQVFSGAPHWLVTTQTVVDDMLGRAGEIMQMVNPLRKLKLDAAKFTFDKNYKREMWKQKERHFRQSARY